MWHPFLRVRLLTTTNAPLHCMMALGTLKTRYTLSADAPGSFFVQAATGVIFGQFDSAGTVTFSLLAVDKAGQSVVAEVYTFEVVEHGEFKVLEYVHVPHPHESYTDPATTGTNNYAVGETYRFAPLNITKVEHTLDAASELGFTVEGAPPGFLINPSDGYIQGTPTAGAADQPPFTMALFAVDGRNRKALIETITLHIKYKDTDVPSNGPNGQPCNNSGVRIDSVLFDGSFACDCSASRFTGDNCDELIALPSASTGADGESSTSTVVGAMAGAVVFVFCVGLLIFKRREQAIKMRAFDFEAEISRLITAGEIDADDEAASRAPREVKRTHVTMTEMIGEGAFGEVWKAVLDETAAGGVPGYMVAVKTSKETKGEGAEEMLREATVMAQVSGHPNLVALIGVVTSGAPLLLLLSLCENGSLLSLLKKRKQKGPRTKPLTLAERMKFALDTARGMEHLMANKFVHRDLAARNVLVDALFSCKVADFGLARGIAGARAGPETNEDGDEEDYYRSRTGTFPVRWTAPEAMQSMRFTEGSDVWSFGITMIEVFTDGDKPYATMDNAAVISQVQGGYRAPQPAKCTDDMYELMLKCWHAKQVQRPGFVALVKSIQQIIDATTATVVGGVDHKQKKKGAKKGGGAGGADGAGKLVRTNTVWDDRNSGSGEAGGAVYVGGSTATSGGRRGGGGKGGGRSTAAAVVANATYGSAAAVVVNSTYSSDAPSSGGGLSSTGGVGDGGDDEYLRVVARVSEVSSSSGKQGGRRGGGSRTAVVTVEEDDNDEYDL
jgi:hypothetical protein